MAMIDNLLEGLELERTGDSSFRAPATIDDKGRHVVFGGELLGQAIVSASALLPDKRVKSVQTIFARGIHTASPVDIDVETMHDGRTFGSATVTFTQDDRLCARALALADVAEPDLACHQDDPLELPAPDESRAFEHPLAAPETIIVDDVDINDPALVGPPSLQLWVRFRGAPDGDHAMARALLAYATDGWLIATAMRPHQGIGQSMAHREISTGVVSHALVFHSEFDVRDWLLIDHHSTFAGGGRCYGRANIHDARGALVASFTQEALLRHFSEGQDPTGKERTIF